MEENRRFSWANLFIKVILVILFVLFTVWLLSLANKDMSNSLDVLTNDIFAQNIERMKEVGKEYFTTERLPQKVGEIETLTLGEMYEKKLILEIKDKYGNTCDADDSYVSIEKFDTEYQMKVNLECNEEEEYIIVIMGCYDYCDTDICEKKEEKTEDKTENKVIEYEYKKSTGGKWTDFGNWSEWSKVSVTKTDYRQVETKTEYEKYSYNKTVTETVYTNFDAECPSGYSVTSDGTKCSKKINGFDYADPVCPSVSGYTLDSRDGFTCSYTKTVTSTADPVCPEKDGWNVSRNGFTCNYTKTTTSTITANPVCPSKSGYTLIGRDGFTCSYSKTTTSTTTANPVCPSKSGYTLTGRNGFTCSYSRTVTSSSYTLQYVSTQTGSYVPADTSTYDYQQVSADYVYDCNNSCAMRWVYTYKVYKKVYGTTTETITATASCPSGYSKSGSTCATSTTSTQTSTGTASCPSGYSKSGSTCATSTSSTQTSTGTANCPSGYSKSGSTCSSTSISTTTKTASCPSEYSKSGNTCAKPTVSYSYKDLIKSCPSGYGVTSDSSRCYKNVTTTVPVSGTKEVTYYRYRVREYIGGTVDYKWSTSKEDKKLLDAGYKLTGRTR